MGNKRQARFSRFVRDPRITRKKGKKTISSTTVEETDTTEMWY